MDDRVCSLGDGKPVYARGWCQTHYMRAYTHGDPRVTKRILGDDRRRFESKVERGGPGDCHPWAGSVDHRNGYGSFWQNGKMRRAHIVAWEFTFGLVPAGKDLDHECHNNAVRDGNCLAGICRHRLCCNPSHLQPKTRQEHADATEPFRHAAGSAHGRAKLTESQIPEIRAMLAAGQLSLAAIGRLYGVQHGTIRAIQEGRTWRSV